MKYTIEKANEFINKNKANVNTKYKPKYHFSALCGWINDPNGLIYYNGKFHLFYQYYPYDSKWGPMHWGHSISSDLIHFDYPSIALAPDLDKNESGCFSGGALIDDDKLKLVYTRHYENINVRKEDIYMAYSSDGVSFVKTDKPLFDNELLPKEYKRDDFRDPSPYYIDGKYYVFVGGKNECTNQGLIIVLEGSSLNNLTYSFTIGPFYELGEMAECPSYHRVNSLDLLVVSGCNVKPNNNSFYNPSSSVFILGKIDFVNKKMDIFKIKEIDKGDSFYAPQFISNIEKPIMIGWMEMWGRKIPTDEYKHGFAGAFSIPRVVEIVNNDIYQHPIDLSTYFVDESSAIIKNTSYLKCKATGYFNLTLEASNGSIRIYSNESGFYLDTTNVNNYNPIIRKTDIAYNNVDFEILLDTSSIEIFINNGEYAITSRCYLDGDYRLTYDNNVTVITKYLKL